jgi:hypothetical protein
VLNCCKLLWTILSGFGQKITDFLNMRRREKLLRLEVMPLKRVVYSAANFINTYVISTKFDADRKLEK